MVRMSKKGCLKPCIVRPGRRVSFDELLGEASEGEGACLSLFADRSHLPLRGKLGWMTPRAGVKTTSAIETRLPGLPVPSGGPIFYLTLLQGSPANRPSLVGDGQLDEAGLTRRMIHA